MRIRLRASDFGSDRFSSKPNLKISFVQIETGFSVRNRIRRWCWGHFVCLVVIQQYVFELGKFKPTATTDLSGAAKRRAECTSLGPGLKHPSLHRLSLVWPRRDVPRRFTGYCFQSSIRPRHDDLLLLLLLLCTLVWYVATKGTHWVCCCSWSLGPSPRRPTASCSLAAERRGDCLRASIATRTFVCTS